MQCNKKKPKIRIPEGLYTKKFGMTFSSYKEQLLWGDGISCYTWFRYKSFLCIFVKFILIPQIHTHWIKPDPGDSNFHSSAGLWLSIHQIKTYRTTSDHRTVRPHSNLGEQDSSVEVEEEVDLLWSPHCSWVNAIKDSRCTDHRKGGSPKTQLASSATRL